MPADFLLVFSVIVVGRDLTAPQAISEIFLHKNKRVSEDRPVFLEERRIHLLMQKQVGKLALHAEHRLLQPI